MAPMRRSIALFAIFALFSRFASGAAPVEEEGVLVLTDSNFDAAVNSEPVILVEFYAPCGHCKSLAPEYAKAAQQLKADGVKLAKVDATAETKVAGRFEIGGYPTLKIFRNGVASEYNGPRQAQGIVDYMLVQSQPGAKKVATLAELEERLAKLHGGSAPEPQVVYFAAAEADCEGKKKPAMAEAFLQTADAKREEVSFAWTADKAAAAKFGAKAGGVAVLLPPALKGKEEQMVRLYSGKAAAAALQEWLPAAVVPLVGELSARTHPRYAALGKPLVRVALESLSFASDAKGANYWLNRIRRAAKAHPEVAFAAVPTSHGDLREYGVDGKAFSVTVEDFAKGAKYAMEGAWSPKEEAALLEGFLAKLQKGELEPYVKSEPLPEGKANGVTVAVGRNFESVVLDDAKDVLIEFYAPWCGHCKSLAPKYEQLAQKLAGVETLTIAKIDATANDWTRKDQYEAKGYPTILFKAAGAAAPVSYDGEREVEAMAAWLAKHATHKFAVPGAAPKKKAAKKAAKDAGEL